MKIEINIARNGDGNPCVVISSPSKEEIVVKEISEEWYNDIEIDSLQEIVESDIPNILANEDSNIGVFIGALRPRKDDTTKRHALYLYDETEDGFPRNIKLTGISKKQFKCFKSLDPLQKLEMAYHIFKEQ